MSGVAIAGKLLATNAAWIAYAGGADKVWPLSVPDTVVEPYARLYLAGNVRDEYLAEAGKVYVSRVSVELTGKPGTPSSADRLAEIAYEVLGDALERAVNVKLDGEARAYIATMWPAGSDVSDYEDTNTLPRRIVDFYVRWRLAG